jgi:hypothetical protein
MTYQPQPYGPTPQQPSPGWAPPPQAPVPSGRGRLIAVLVVFGAIIVGIIALVVVRTIQKGPMFGGGPTLAAAEAECNKGRSGGDLADGGKTLIIDLRGTSPAEQIRGAMDADTFACILGHLETPSSVTAHIEGTRALDGQQTDSWDGFSARWTYHPDHGLQMTIEQK